MVISGKDQSSFKWEKLSKLVLCKNKYCNWLFVKSWINCEFFKSLAQFDSQPPGLITARPTALINHWNLAIEETVELY